MKKIETIIALAIVCMMAGCTITGRISRRHTAAEITHSTRRQGEGKSEKEGEGIEQRRTAAEHRKGYIEYTRADNSKAFLIPTVTDADGGRVMQLDIEAVRVTARSRSLPERNGKVSLDFVVTLPKELMGSCRSVEVTPVLYKQGHEIPLQELTIRGALYNKVQERNYWQYDRYLSVFAPDETGRQRAYERFIHHPYPKGTRLDSVVTSRTGIRYFYTQEVSTAGSEGNRLSITLQGRVSAASTGLCFRIRYCTT